MSKETDCLIQYVKALVPDAVVSAVLGRYISKDDPCSPHTAKSAHCAEATDGKGLAVDWGGTEAQRAAVFHALEPVAPQMAELFHNGSGITRVVKNGVWHDGLVTLGAVTWVAHRNHTHSAVHKGTFLIPAVVIPPPAAHTETVPIPVHDFEELAVKQTMMHIGKLDDQGRGWSDWNPGLGRDPNVIALTLLGPSPPDDGYWEGQGKVQLSAQAHGGAVRVTVRNGAPGDTVSCFVTVS